MRRRPTKNSCIMTRGLQAASHSLKSDVSLLVRTMSIMVCPKSSEVDDICNNEHETRRVVHSPLRKRSDSTPQHPSTFETERLATQMINFERSAFTSIRTQSSFTHFEISGKRSCDQEVGPSQKGSLSKSSIISSFASSDAESASSPLEIDSDVSDSKLSAQREHSLSAVLERYDTVTREPHLVRMYTPRNGVSAPEEIWISWVRLFMPTKASEQRQDGIAALAQLRHMIRRHGFMRFVTELASLSQTLTTDRCQGRTIQNFMEMHELLGESSPLRVNKKIRWSLLRQLVKTGECPAWLLHKALQDQINSAGPLRPFLSFLTAAAEVYKGLPERVLRELENKVEPESFVQHRSSFTCELNFLLRHQASIGDNAIEPEAQSLQDPGV
eukprot:Blabericola_migrator_1__6194@NODE_3128_length_2017_cov_10_531795_g1958_i0_p1_GENE_NODE_3128_length_2017_cov_10_531795_g1958_i0NODE_3128_length_2017_cov_10_531795_g1958_i0_p1_ORF_typecomplete_len386_score52_57_NODE_3128_length_2017_cov_10_531795_g1958_i05681725